jgi:1,4-alpha-glucan branching enzyme
MLKKVSKSQAPAKQQNPVVEGMGAIPQDVGVGFRVWAPYAKSVSVIGEFNDWNETANMLAHEQGGYWYGLVTDAKVGHAYKFSIVGQQDQRLNRIDPYAFEVSNSVGHGIIHDHNSFDWQGDDFATPPLDKLVIYEMHVGTFVRPDPGRPGKFSLVKEKIDHLKHIGVNAIQIMPVSEFAGDLSWGYNPAHIFAVESGYGGPNGLKDLVRELHKNGLAVIMDVVYNHFGPSDLDLWQFDGWSDNQKGGIYFYNDHRSTTPWGDTRPDYGRGEVRQFIRDNAMMWLDQYHVDGLRFDMTLYIRSIAGNGDDDVNEGWGLMQWINEEIRARFPQKFTIAEDLRNNPWMTKSPGEGGAGFHAQWDANFVHPVREAVITPDDTDRSMESIKNAILHHYDGDAFRRVVYSESHDEVANGKARIPHEIDSNAPDNWFAQKRSTLAAGLVFTVPGIPMIFQGQEFLESGWFRDDVPLDWDKNETFSGIARLYSDLARLRTNEDGQTPGLLGHGVDIIHFNEADNMIAFRRFDHEAEAKSTVVILNFANTSRENYQLNLPSPGLWKIRLNSDSSHYSQLFGNFGEAVIETMTEGEDDVQNKASIALAAYSFLILSQ